MTQPSSTTEAPTPETTTTKPEITNIEFYVGKPSDNGESGVYFIASVPSTRAHDSVGTNDIEEARRTLETQLTAQGQEFLFIAYAGANASETDEDDGEA